MPKKLFLMSTNIFLTFFLVSIFVSEAGCKDSKVDFNMNQKYLYEIFKQRRSVRNFRPDPIPENHIIRMIDIARTAPTVGNQQPWKFKVFDIPERFQQICVIPIGIPEDWPDPPDKKSLDEFIVVDHFPANSADKASIEKHVIELDKKVLQQYVGDYDYKGELIITISLENDQLFMESAGQQKVKIFPESETKFFLKITDASVTFIKNNENRVIEMIAHQQGQDFRAIKMK